MSCNCLGGAFCCARNDKAILDEWEQEIIELDTIQERLERYVGGKEEEGNSAD